MLTSRWWLISMLVIALPSHAAAETWKSGFGQGVVEATVEKGPGNYIRVSCEAGFGKPVTGIDFHLAGQSPRPNSNVTLIFDNEDPVEVQIDQFGQIGSNCRACESWFTLVLNGIRKHRSVYVRFENGLGTRFSLTGASKAIGTCEPDFAKNY